jgi:hypothetical protein
MSNDPASSSNPPAANPPAANTPSRLDEAVAQQIEKVVAFPSPQQLLSQAAMTSPITPSLRDRLKAATQADEELETHLAECSSAEAAGLRSPALDDVAVLREKYRTVTEFIQHGERAMRGIQACAVRAADPELHPQAANVIREVREATQQGVGQLPPPYDLIALDLARTTEAQGPAFNKSRYAWALLFQEGWQAVDDALRDENEEQLLSAFLIVIVASTGYLGTSLVPACQLQTALAHQLCQPASTPLPSPSRTNPDRSAASAELLSALPVTDSLYRFRLFGEIWLVNFEQEFTLVVDDKGMGIIARLLAAPNKSITALALMNSDPRDKAAERHVVKPVEFAVGDEDEPNAPAGGSDYDILDDDAVKEYRKRSEAITDELEQARENKDTQLITKLEAELKAIKGELDKATFRGRKRKLSSSAELKASGAIRKALDRTYAKLTKGNSPMLRLVSHLSKHIEPQGVSYAYRPSPSLSWDL